MSRVMAVIACGFMLAACSTTMPSLDFMKSAPQAESLAIESEPPGAEAKTSLGQSCSTPCQLSVEPGSEFSVALALSGYQPQTVSVRPEAVGATAPPRLAPNPGSRGPAGSGTGKEAGCEEKEDRGGSGSSSSDGPHGLGSAGADVRACSCPGALALRDQLSLAVAIVLVCGGRGADTRVHQTPRMTGRRRRLRYFCIKAEREYAFALLARDTQLSLHRREPIEALFLFMSHRIFAEQVARY